MAVDARTGDPQKDFVDHMDHKKEVGRAEYRDERAKHRDANRDCEELEIPFLQEAMANLTDVCVEPALVK